MQVLPFLVWILQGGGSSSPILGIAGTIWIKAQSKLNQIPFWFHLQLGKITNYISWLHIKRWQKKTWNPKSQKECNQLAAPLPYEAVPWTGFPASASVNLLCPLPVDTGQQITSILSADAYMQTAEGVVRTQGVGRWEVIRPACSSYIHEVMKRTQTLIHA